MTSSNYHAILSGLRNCSINQLNKILSGIGYEAQISTKIIIQAIPTGEIVDDVGFAQGEEILLSEETESETIEDNDQFESYLSEKPPEKPKTQREYPSLDDPGWS